MCNFASFVLTKNNVYYLETVNSHEDIIDHYNLNDNDYNIVRIELKPPQRDADLQNVDLWDFKVDQDEYPDWTYKGDPALEAQARKALARRIEEQKIYYTIEKGTGAIVNVGYKGTAIVGRSGQAIAGYSGIAIAGDGGTATTGDHGISTAGAHGTAIAGIEGVVTVGYSGMAFVGEYGQAKANNDSFINIKYYDYESCRMRTLTGYIGENDLKANVFYKVITKNKFTTFVEVSG